MPRSKPRHTTLHRSRFLHWLQGEEPRWGTRPEDLDPRRIEHLLAKLGPLFSEHRAYFRIEIDGWDHVPAVPSLVVSNHSGGTTVPDAWGLASSWYRRFGVQRPLHGLAHEMVFALEPVGRRLAQLGMLRAHPQLAHEVLTTWRRDVFVMPGGDLETWRPFKDRYRVRFSGRQGYARLALKAGVPIVPVAHAGSHHTLIVLTDGRRLAERLHFQELFRARIFPVHLSLPYGLGVGPLPHLPIPVKLRYRIAEPVWPHVRVPPGQEPPQGAIDELDAEVRARLQGELDALKEASTGLAARLARALEPRRGRRPLRDGAAALALAA